MMIEDCRMAFTGELEFEFHDVVVYVSRRLQFNLVFNRGIDHPDNHFADFLFIGQSVIGYINGKDESKDKSNERFHRAISLI